MIIAPCGDALGHRPRGLDRAGEAGRDRGQVDDLLQFVLCNARVECVAAVAVVSFGSMVLAGMVHSFVVMLPVTHRPPLHPSALAQSDLQSHVVDHFVPTRRATSVCRHNVGAIFVPR